MAVTNSRAGGDRRRGQEEETGGDRRARWARRWFAEKAAKHKSLLNGPVMVVFRTAAVNIIVNVTKISALLHCICYHERSVTVTAVRPGVRMNRVSVLPVVNTGAGWNGGEGKLVLKCPPQKAC